MKRFFKIVHSKYLQNLPKIKKNNWQEKTKTTQCWAQIQKECNLGKLHYLPQRLKSMFYQLFLNIAVPKKVIFFKILILAFEVILVQIHCLLH